ncbi:RNA-directed DNA polymerase, eukaryota, reverse transcriptase zinc-binding domain protein, partial [Tanacetum coccineum]
GETSKLQQNGDGNGMNNSMNTSTKVSSSKINDTSTLVKLANSFSALHDEENDIDKGVNTEQWVDANMNINESDSEEIEELIMEADPNAKKNKIIVKEGASTPVGDFNAALFLDDMVAGPASLDIAMREFTWNHKPKGMDGVLKKIDRVMSNLDFNDVFQGAHVIFQPYRISDHAPAVLSIPTAVKVKPKPFKFFNILVHNVRFKEVVLDGWNVNVSGFHMFKVVQRLKNLKKPIRKMLYDHGNIHENVKRLRVELDKVQRDLDLDPFNNDLRDEEAAYVQAFNEALLMEERFLKQKAKIQWLRAGDTNSTYFHKSVKSRASRSRIDVITNSEGVLFENDKVANVFLSHYEVFLGQAGNASVFNTSNL